MSREVLTEEERRQRRNEASRRCYLKRKAMLGSQAQPMGAKNARGTEAKPKRGRPSLADSRNPLLIAEKFSKKYAKTAAGVKPMVKEAAELIESVYKTGDQKTVKKVEHILEKELGIAVVSGLGKDQTKSKAVLEVCSKSMKTPAFRLNQPSVSDENADAVEIDEPVQDETEELENLEIPADPSVFDNIESGTEGDIDIDIPDDEDEYDEDLDDEYDDEDDDEDEDEDEDDDYKEDKRSRRDRLDAGSAQSWESGRWEMMGEMDAQGAFDD